MFICLEQGWTAGMEGNINSTGGDVEPSTYIGFHTSQKISGV